MSSGFEDAFELCLSLKPELGNGAVSNTNRYLSDIVNLDFIRFLVRSKYKHIEMLSQEIIDLLFTNDMINENGYFDKIMNVLEVDIYPGFMFKHLRDTRITDKHFIHEIGLIRMMNKYIHKREVCDLYYLQIYDVIKAGFGDIYNPYDIRINFDRAMNVDFSQFPDNVKFNVKRQFEPNDWNLDVSFELVFKLRNRLNIDQESPFNVMFNPDNTGNDIDKCTQFIIICYSLNIPLHVENKAKFRQYLRNVNFTQKLLYCRLDFLDLVDDKKKTILEILSSVSKLDRIHSQLVIEYSKLAKITDSFLKFAGVPLKPKFTFKMSDMRFIWE